MACSGGGCFETKRIGDMYYILDTKDANRAPLAVYTTAEYEGTARNPGRLELAWRQRDSRLMFDSLQQITGMSEVEISAYTDYICARLLHHLDDGTSVIAYSGPRDMPASRQPGRLVAERTGEQAVA